MASLVQQNVTEIDYVILRISSLFIFIVDKILFRFILSFKNLPVDEYLSCFQLFAIVNRITLSIYVQVFLWM